MTDFKALVELATETDTQTNVPCDIKVDIEGEQWTAYEASVSYRDILLFTDKGTVTLLVDSYSGRHVAEVFDWNRE